MLDIMSRRDADTIFIKYEDLVLKYEDVLVALSEFLETKLPPMESNSKESAIFNSHATSPTAKSSIGRWREQLSDMEKKELGKGLGGFLAQFEYEGV
jgi:hypothetical protein